MAGRLQILRPMLKENLVIEVLVDNRMVATDVTAMRPQIEEFLRKELQNSRLTMHIIVEEAKSTHRILSRVEQYQAIEQHNPAVRKLKELLDLDLS